MKASGRKQSKPKITKEERRAKYTQIARERKAKGRAKAASRNLICYHCRQHGHSVADCPNQESNARICYKCGSTEHALANCPDKSSSRELPYATCFVCKQTGHLASSCPQNEKGVYVNGGCCKTCGSKQHRATDCPEKRKKKERVDPIDKEEEKDYTELLEGHGDQQATKESSKTVEKEKASVSKKRRVVKF